MKWFKHYSNAKHDPKIRRLINKFGIDGYGLYFAVVESIAFQLETNKPIPDLEENANDIAEFFKMNAPRVEEILKYCISPESGLFEFDPETNRILCLKLLLHLDNTMCNNPEIKKIINNFKKLEETSSSLKQIRLDKIRLDKNKETPSRQFKKPQPEEIQSYLDSLNCKLFSGLYFYDKNEATGWVVGKNRTPMKDWKAVIRTWISNNKESKKSKEWPLM